MRTFALSSILLVGLSIPTLAADTEKLQSALGHLPESILASPRADLAHFVDLTVLYPDSGDEFSPKRLARARLASLMHPLEAFRAAGPQNWLAKAGTSLASVQFFLSHGRQPEQVIVWGLESKAAAAELAQTLRERDFEPLDNGVIGNGEPLVMNPAQRDIGNPWRSKVGAASFVKEQGPSILQAGIPELVTSSRNVSGGGAASQILSTALHGFTGVADGQTILQAVLVSPVLGMKGLDPSSVFSETKSVAELQSRLAEQVKNSGQGLPPYLAGIIVDIDAERPTVAISLAYTDCETAERAAKLMVDRWALTMPEPAQGTLHSGFAQHENLCAATLTITAEQANSLANPIFDTFLAMYTRGSFTALRFGADNAGEQQ